MMSRKFGHCLTPLPFRIATLLITEALILLSKKFDPYDRDVIYGRTLTGLQRVIKISKLL
jgi:hypothetical protein